MDLDARRDAGFPRSCMTTYCEEGKPSPNEAAGQFREPQENAWEICRLNVQRPLFGDQCGFADHFGKGRMGVNRLVKFRRAALAGARD